LFRGQYEHTIDSKGRISIPSRFREILGKKYDDRLVITNYDHCLVAYPNEEWSELEQKLSTLPQMKKEVQAFYRFIYSSAIDCVIDKQGRLLIPQSLRDYADLQKDVVLVGEMKKIEIWAKERWDIERKKVREEFDQIRDTMAAMGM
jgi:MraZ protein